MGSIKQRVLARAAELGADVEYGGTGTRFEVLIAAPDGYRWACDEVHQLVHSIWDDELPADLWKAAHGRMADGLEPCPEDCECRDE